MSTETVVIAIEGVLAGSDDDVDLTQCMLDPTGALIYHGMSQTSRIILATNLDRRIVTHWCRAVGLTAHMAVVGLSDTLVRKLRSGGDNPTLYVDANSSRSAAALQDGVPVLLFTRPLFARASHRADLVGDRIPRAWDDVVAEMGNQETARHTMLDLLGKSTLREDMGD